MAKILNCLFKNAGSIPAILVFALVAQLVEHQFCKLVVVGSSPTGGLLLGRSKVDQITVNDPVAGSSPALAANCVFRLMARRLLPIQFMWVRFLQHAPITMIKYSCSPIKEKRSISMPNSNIKERLLSKMTIIESSCWQWFGASDKTLYGRIKVSGKVCLAHRVAYELFKGQIPKGLEIDHLCRNRKCINPNHLEAVTRQVNTIRGIGPILTKERCSKQTHCAQGHPLYGDNLELNLQGKYTLRRCRACKLANKNKWNQNRDRRKMAG